MDVLLGLFGMTTSWAFATLIAGAAVLSAMLVLAARNRPRWTPLIAVVGLYLIADALETLKDRTVPRQVDAEPHFMVVRNALSLALIAVPLSLALLMHPSARCRRTTAAVIGMLGALLIPIATMGWFESLSEERRLWIAAARWEIAWPLARDGTMLAARWLWFAGAVMLALPTARSVYRRWRGVTVRTDTDLSWTLGGLAVSSAAMAIFFWHQGDDRHRFYAYLIMALSAYLAPLLMLGEMRVFTARWTRHVLGGFGVVLAAWTLIGLPGSTYSTGSQDFADFWITALLLYFVVLALPVLVGHLLLRTAVLAVRRRRTAFK